MVFHPFFLGGGEAVHNNPFPPKRNGWHVALPPSRWLIQILTIDGVAQKMKLEQLGWNKMPRPEEKTSKTQQKADKGKGGYLPRGMSTLPRSPRKFIDELMKGGGRKKTPRGGGERVLFI